MKYIVDTNILVAYILNGLIELTSEEQEAVEFFSKLKINEIVVPEFVLTELALVMPKIIPNRYNYRKDREILNSLHLRTTTILVYYYHIGIILDLKPEDRKIALKVYEDLLLKKAKAN